MPQVPLICLTIIQKCGGVEASLLENADQRKSYPVKQV